MAVAAGRKLYKGGPYVAAFAGATPAVLEDSWVLTAANDNAGAIQTWYPTCSDVCDRGGSCGGSGRQERILKSTAKDAVPGGAREGGY